MQMVKNILLSLFVIWFSLLLFMPKQEIYYALEKKFEKNAIKINEQDKEEGLFSFKTKHSTLYINGVKTADIKKVDFFISLFYNTIEFTDILLHEPLKSLIPNEIDTIILSYVAWSPLTIQIITKNTPTTITGYINLDKRLLHLDFHDIEELDKIKTKLKKNKKGWYYETSF